MRSASQLVIEREHVRVLACEPPLSLRVCDGTVYLVASAAGPIGGDDVALDLEARDDTHVAVCSTAATIALPGPDGAQSRFRVRACVGNRGSLRWHPEPLVLAARCHHLNEARVSLSATARCCWRELVVLGRDGERPGRCRTRLHVDRDGVAVLRHELVIGEPDAPHDAYAVLGAARVVGTLVVVDDVACPPNRTWQHRAVHVTLLPLERAGALVCALGDDTRAVHEALDAAEVMLHAATG